MAFAVQAQRLGDTVSVISLKKDSSFIFQKNIQVLPANYYTSKFGFMCKQELLLEKKTKIPFRIRLGSLAYTNMLEGKNN
jgi:hypothetical protein